MQAERFAAAAGAVVPGLGVVIQGLGFAVRRAPCLQGEGFAAAAGAVALALGAGVVMSALAIDLTDAAVASAILAAGIAALMSTPLHFRQIVVPGGSCRALHLPPRLSVQRMVSVATYHDLVR